MLGWRARLGFIIPSTDIMQEIAYHEMVQEGISLHFTRIALKEVTLEALEKMRGGIEEATKLLSNAHVDAISYGCTSGTIAIGADGVKERIKKVDSDIEVTTMATAVIKALKVLEIEKVALVTPYVEDINKREVDFLAKHGINVVDIKSLGIKDDYRISKVSKGRIYRLSREADISEADGIFISCGDLRSHRVIDVLEEDTDKLVVTSNQATIWQTLRKVGVRNNIQGFGKLLEEF